MNIKNIKDYQINDPNDELYDLQKKYNVKISRSNSSNAVYISRTDNYRIRIGHYIDPKSNHIRNFKENIVRKNVSKSIVEKVIQKYFK